MTHARRPHRSLGVALAWLATVSLLLLLAAAPGSTVLAGDGSNGTVKIHEGSDHSDPPKTDKNNQPHVCTFHIHGFGFDADDAGPWRIYDWPPTGTKSQVLAGTWSGSEWQSQVISLPDGHYRLVIDIDGDKNDTKDDDTTADKHKEFWVECAAPSESPSEEPTEQPTDTAPPTEAPTEQPTEAPTEQPTEAPTEQPTEQPTEAPTEQPTETPTEQPTETPTEQPTETPTATPTTPPSGGVEGATGTPNLTPPATDRLASATASDPASLPLVLFALVATSAGVLVLVRTRRMRRS
jgi:hypothetical protein